MRNKLLLVCLTFLSFGLPDIVIAQTASISGIRVQNEKVVVTVSSTEAFYIGNNIHVLYIGDKHFDLYDQNNSEQKGTLTYYIPKEDFSKLADGAKVFLSYGEATFDTEEDFNDLLKADPERHWILGKLDKSMMK